MYIVHHMPIGSLATLLGGATARPCGDQYSFAG